MIFDKFCEAFCASIERSQITRNDGRFGERHETKVLGWPPRRSSVFDLLFSTTAIGRINCFTFVLYLVLGTSHYSAGDLLRNQ